MALTQATLAYLGLPLLIFLLGWLKPFYAMPLAVLLVLLLVRWGNGRRERAKGEVRDEAGAESCAGPSAGLGVKSLLICGVVALLWTAASGAGGFGFQTADWHKHNAVLKVLLSSDWPVLFGPDKSLVYNLGYYLPAAAFGKLFGATDAGWTAVNLFVYAWTAVGVCLVLLWFVHHVRGRPELFAPLFVVLGGLDVIAWLTVPRDGLEMEPFPAGIGYLQFSGMAAALNWAPQHTLPAWLGAALFLQLKDEPGLYRNAMLLGGCLLLWSSFAALGIALLMAAWLMIRPQLVRDALSPSALLQQTGGILLSSVVVLYIMSSNFSMLHGFFAATITEHGLWPRYAYFLLMEFGLVAIAAFLLLPPGSHRRKLLIALSIILALIPLYRIGWSHDMAMRASLPALFVFWCLVLSSFHDRHLNSLRTITLKTLITAAVALGSATALRQELRLPFVNTTPPPPPALEEVLDISQPTTADSNQHVATEQYHGHRQSLFFRFLTPCGIEL